MPQPGAANCSRFLESALHPLLERARKLVLLEQTVVGLLPENLATHCKVLNLKNETLILGAESPAWASRLRFVGPELISQLQCQFPGAVRSVQVRIQPQHRQNLPAPRPRLKISLDNAMLLAQTARTIEHPGLQEALTRLAAKTQDF